MAQDFEERAGMMSARENLDQQTGTSAPAATPEPTLEDRAGMMSARENLDAQSEFQYIAPQVNTNEKDFYITPPTPADAVQAGIKTAGQKAAMHFKLPLAAQAAGTAVSQEAMSNLIENNESSIAMSAIHNAAEGGFLKSKQEAFEAFAMNPMSEVSDERIKEIGERFNQPLFNDPEIASDFMYGYGIINASVDTSETEKPEFVNEVAAAASLITLQEQTKRLIQLVEDEEAVFNGRESVDMEAEGMSFDFLSPSYWFNSGKAQEGKWWNRFIPFATAVTGLSQSEAVSDALSIGSVVPNLATFEEGASLAQKFLGDWDATIQNIVALPPEEREAAMLEKLNEIKERMGPLPAFGVQKIFLDRVATMSSTDASLEAAMAGFDLLTGFTAAGIAKGATAGVKATTRVARQRGSVKNALNRASSLGFRPRAQTSVDDVAQTIGDPDLVVDLNVEDIVTSAQNTPEVRHSLSTTTGNMRAWFAPDGNLPSEPARRILEEFVETSPIYQKILDKSVDTVQRVDQSNPEQVRQIIAQTREQMTLERVPFIRHVVAAEPRIPPQLVADHSTNTFDVSFTFGKLDGSGYKREQDAQAFITRELDDSHNAYIEEIAGSYYVRVDRKAVEREGLYDVEKISLTDEQTVPVRLDDTPWDRLRQKSKWLAGSSNRMSDASRADRLKFQGQEANNVRLIKMAHQNRIEGIGKHTRKDILEFLERDRAWSETVETAPGVFERVQGRYAKNIAEFKERFLDQFNKPATDDHVRGYFSYVLLNDQDYALRNLNAYSFKNQIGLREYEVSVGDEIIDGIEGRIEKDIAWDNPGEAGIVVLGETPEFTLSKTYGAATKEVIQEKIKEGYKVIRLSPEGQRKVMTNQKVAEKVGNDVAHYLLVPGDVVSRPLPFQQIPYKPGGHIAYSDGAMVSIPMLKKLKRGGRDMVRYAGDMSLLHFRSTKKAQKAVDQLNKGIDVHKAGGKRLDVEEALRPVWGDMAPSLSRVIVSQEVPEHLAATVKQFGDNVADNLRLSDKIGESNLVRSDTDSFNLFGGMDQEYMGPRNNLLGTAENVGTPSQPLFTREDASLVDYNKTAVQAMESVVNSVAGQDLKMKEALAFHKQFGHLLKTPRSEASINPVMHALNPDWRDNVDNISELTAAKHAQKSLAMFLNQPTATSKFLRNLKQSFIDDIIQSVPSVKGQAILEEKALSTTSDPVKFLRGFAFHWNLGMFNPKQFLLQSSAWTSIAAISGPKHAAKGLSAYQAARASMLTKKENVLEFVAKKAMGWDKDQFQEAWSLLQDTGFHHVGGEAANRLDTEGPKVVSSKFGKFLDAGAFFFNEGERLPRMSGYFAAYSELAKRKGVRTGALNPTDLEKDWLIRRADDVTYNMTRVGSAEWQRGITSVPTQFVTYQTRLMDHMFGHRLTKMEKLRLMAVHSAMFGMVSGTAGTALGLLPWQETTKQALIEAGVNDEVEQNKILNALVNGVPAMILKEITGTQYDVTATFGPSGLSQLWDFVNGDTPILDTLGGPGGVEFRQFLERSFAMTEVGKDMLGFNPPPPEVIWDALKDMVSGISTAGNAMQLYTALNLARRETITGKLVASDPASPVEAIMKFLTGVTREKDSDIFRYIKGTDKLQTEIDNQIKRAAEWRLKAFKSSDPAAYKHYNAKRDAIVLGLDIENQKDAMKKIEDRAEAMYNEAFGTSVKEKWFGLTTENIEEQTELNRREIEEIQNGR